MKQIRAPLAHATRSLLAAALAVAVAVSPFWPKQGRAEETSEGYRVTRVVERTYPPKGKGDNLHGKIVEKYAFDVRNAGELLSGTVAIDWQVERHVHRAQCQTIVPVTGRLSSNRLEIVTPPYRFNCTGCDLAKDDLCISLVRAEHHSKWASIDLMLTDNRYQAPPLVSTWRQLSGPTFPDFPVTITTVVEPVTATPSGSILVVAANELIPGGAVTGEVGPGRHFGNKVTFKLPEHPLLAEAQRNGRRISIRAEATAYGGRLFRESDVTVVDGSYIRTAGQGHRWIDFIRESGVPGERGGDGKSFYYAWPGDPPPTAQTETIRLIVEEPKATGLTGEVSFAVGIDIDVDTMDFVEERTRRWGVEEPLTIRLRETFGRGDVKSVLEKLELTPILTIEQTGHEKNDWLVLGLQILGLDALGLMQGAVAGAMDIHAADPTKRPTLITGTDMAWPVGAEGELVSGGSLSRPELFFRAVGTHRFKAEVKGLLVGRETAPKAMLPRHPRFANRGSGGAEMKVEVTDPPLQAGFAGVVYSCLSALKDTLAIMTANPAKVTQWQKLSFVWSYVGCLQSGGEFVVGARDEEARDRRLELIAGVVGNLSDAPPEALRSPRGDAVPRASDDAETLGIQQAQVAVRAAPDVRLVVIPRQALSDFEIESASGGVAKGSGSSPLPHEGRSFVVAAIAKGERSRLKLGLTGQTTNVYVVTAEGIIKGVISASGREAALAVGDTAQLEVVGGGAIKVETVPLLDMGTPPRIPQIPATGATAASSEAERAPVVLEPGCSYRDYHGTCTIVSTDKTPASMAQAGTVGGPGIEGHEVRFAFTSRAQVVEPVGQGAMRDLHHFRLKNAWYPGPRYLEKYDLRPGKSLACVLKVRTAGACAPLLFEFDEIDRSDDFETQAKPQP